MTKLSSLAEQVSALSPIYFHDSYERINETDDAFFYKTDRFVNHLDSLALQTVEDVIGSLIIEEKPVILDLMAGWDSHVPSWLKPGKVIGLGLNENELKSNKILDKYILHDVNRNPSLPFPDAGFDAVINTVSVDYMTRPVEVFKEAGRILKPGGLFLVVFSNRMFPEKAVKLWRNSSEDERVIIVEEFFKETGLFERPSLFVSKGKPRPADDKYASEGIPSDPVYAVYAERMGGNPLREKRPNVKIRFGALPSEEVIEARKKAVKNTLCCPYCGEKMSKWKVPDNPFCQTWDNDFMYICFNDMCSYYIRGWDVMYRDTNQGMSYRCMFNPVNGCCSPMPVPTPFALREGIIP
ncbi:MAG: methyltransferase domain-containing protein [Desulfobacteraceae bacterium]|nr:MAG: methyltransferase domain-containing protein [Desulfobacteraceae bacterium]